MTELVDDQVAREWLRRWDVQQTGYLPFREERFEIMLDAVASLAGDEQLTIVDLCCGPGSFTQRILQRFPTVRCISVDLDPVLLGLARRSLGTGDGRVRWVEADLTTPDWASALGVTDVNAIVSTTALHWLDSSSLVSAYRAAHGLLRPGGVLLNGDHMDYSATQPTFTRLAAAVDEHTRRQAFDIDGVEDYAQWHAALAEAIPDLPYAERDRRFAQRKRDARTPGFDLHAAALRDAGFSEVDTIWQRYDNRVLLAVR